MPKILAKLACVPANSRASDVLTNGVFIEIAFMARILGIPYQFVKHTKHKFIYNVRMSLQDRINELFDDHPDKSYSDLARYLKITKTSVSEWVHGKTKTIAVENAFGVARFFNANPEWVGIGKGPKYLQSVNERKQIYTSIKNIPVVGQAQLGDNGYWIDMGYPEGFGDGYIEFPSNDRQAYALRCIGDSMRPRIRNGEFVIIEPSIEVNYGDDVLIKSIDGRVMVKTLLYKRDGRIYLQSINENHPNISFPTEEIESMYYVAAIVPSNRWMKYP